MKVNKQLLAHLFMQVIGVIVIIIKVMNEKVYINDMF
jgi:hypothetical protein